MGFSHARWRCTAGGGSLHRFVRSLRVLRHRVAFLDFWVAQCLVGFSGSDIKILNPATLLEEDRLAPLVQYGICAVLRELSNDCASVGLADGGALKLNPIVVVDMFGIHREANLNL